MAPTLGRLLRGVLAGPLREGLRLSSPQWKTLKALASCRTSVLGGQVYYCTACGAEQFEAHSCGNRHCPACQGERAVEWLERQAAALLPVPYFHLVFTLPHGLNGLIRQNRRALYHLLFEAASQTLLAFGQGRLKARIGITAVLHTWSQTLLDHYHLHCIVTGGGLALKGEGWVHTPGQYLFAVKALSRMYRGKYLAGLQALYQAGELEFHGQLAGLSGAKAFGGLLRAAAREEWVVYAKRPFAGPGQVLAYLSRYTHRVAISNGRLLAADERSVRFSYKDYAQGAARREMSLSVAEFVRRFCLHVLPERFVKIRHYGLLGNRDRGERIERARRWLGVAPAPAPPAEPAQKPASGVAAKEEPRRCPRCGQVALVWLREEPRARFVSLALVALARSPPVQDSS
jgi:hypothetical protein